MDLDKRMITRVMCRGLVIPVSIKKLVQELTRLGSWLRQPKVMFLQAFLVYVMVSSNIFSEV